MNSTQKNTSLTPKEQQMLQSIENLSSQTVAATVALSLPSRKITTLLDAIHHALPANAGTPALHFVSAHNNEGAEIIALETAYNAAVQIGKRVLLIDASVSTWALTQRLRLKAQAPSFETYLKQDNSASPILQVEDTSFFFMNLYDADEKHGALPSTPVMKAFLDKLRQTFDLVVIHSEFGISNQSALTLATIADTNIIVIEADRTRIPVVKELKRLLETNGGRVMGTILNKRKYYIPRFMYPLLFKA